jgi:glycine/D-amino acid oxidase-like deaminating enzyme
VCPKLTIDKRYDVVVIGAGLIGLASAYFLAKGNYHVLVLERNALVGNECSFGSAATTWPFLIKFREPQMLPFVQRGVDAHLRLSPTIHYEYVDKNCLWIFDSEENSRLAVKQLDDRGIRGWETVDQAKVIELEPDLSDAVVSGIVLSGLYQGDSRQMCAQLAKNLEASGSAILTSAEAISFSAQSDTIEKVTLADGRSFGADYFVVSSGAWSRSLGTSVKYSIPTFPVKGHMLDYTTNSVAVSHLLYTGKFMVRNTIRGGIRVGSTRDYSCFEKTVNERAANRMQLQAEKFLPRLKTNQPEVWTGFRPGTPDGWPIIGFPKSYHNLFLATGHFHEGFTLAACTGEIVAESIKNPEYRWESKELCDPDRFN